MKTICPPGYHQYGFVATHVLGHNRTSCAQMHELPQSHCGDNREAHCFHDNIHITLILLL